MEATSNTDRGAADCANTDADIRAKRPVHLRVFTAGDLPVTKDEGSR
jgi:hypothetical protein